MTDIKSKCCAELQGYVDDIKSAQARSQYDDMSDVPETDVLRMLATARAAIDRIGGVGSTFARYCEEILTVRTHECVRLVRVLGILEALLAAVSADHLTSIEQLIHAEMFSDFIEMAQHLQDEGYKDSATVIAGSALEGHLRRLCTFFGVATEVTYSHGVKAKKADGMNSDLAKAGAYTKLDQKNVTAWLGLRNHAAHGEYDKYSAEQAGLMLAGVRDFMARIQA